MQRYKQPNFDVHPDGEWIRYSDHVEAMKRIAGEGVAQGLTAEAVAKLARGFMIGANYKMFMEEIDILTAAPSASPEPEPPIYAQVVIENVDAMRALLQNMLDEDQFDRADNLLTAIAEGIEEAMSDAHAQGEQEGKDSSKASASPAKENNND